MENLRTCVVAAQDERGEAEIVGGNEHEALDAGISGSPNGVHVSGAVDFLHLLIGAEAADAGDDSGDVV